MNKGFNIIGISTRTTNKNGQALKDLAKLWEQFFTDNILEKIPNKITTNIYSIYTDYKSNYLEEYTTIIGVPVSSLGNIPDGLIGREFPDENFISYLAKGEMPKAVGDTWNEIWQNDKTLNRKYTYDYEVYTEKSNRGENSEVEIFISVH